MSSKEVKKLKIEIRADNTVHIEGYVNAVARDSRILPSPKGKFVEQVEPKTFERALARGDNVNLMHNHKRVIGSTTDGSLQLHEDNIGLYAKATINDVDIIDKAKKGELRGWSFGFEKRADEWEETSNGIPRRKLSDINLNEVSIIDSALTPCYVGTSIETRGEESIINETRSFDNETVEIVNNAKKDDIVETTDTESITKVIRKRSDKYAETERTVFFTNAEKTIEIIKLKQPLI